VPIALATGRPVIGVDTSPSMLDAARRRAEEADVELVLISATWLNYSWTNQPRSSSARFAPSCMSKPGPRAAESSSASPPR